MSQAGKNQASIPIVAEHCISYDLHNYIVFIDCSGTEANEYAPSVVTLF